MASPLPFNPEIRQLTHYHPSVLTWTVIAKRRSRVFTRVQQVIAVTTLGFLVWLWFGVFKDHTPRPSYPYYDTQQPVPPWSEPPPLEGNYAKTGKH